MKKWEERMHWLEDDFDYRFKCLEHEGQYTTNEIISSIQEAIGVGQPHVAIDELPPLTRQLFQDTDFHFIGTRTFKKKDPVEMAKDPNDKNQGNYSEEADLDEIAKWTDILTDRPDVLAYLHKNIAELHNTEDALNHAEYGLTDAVDNTDNNTEVFLDTEKDETVAQLGIAIYNQLDTTGINSTFCGVGYQAPRDKYEFKNADKRSLWHERKVIRDERFGDLLAEAKDLDNIQSIRQFRDRIRDDYYADKAIQKEWSFQMFQECRWIYRESLYKQGLDAETIRRRMAWAFDNVSHYVPAIIFRSKGKAKIHRPSYYVKDSIWNRTRMEEMSKLTFTTKQWRVIYETIKDRESWCKEVGSPCTLECMNKLIHNIKTPGRLEKAKRYLMKKTAHMNKKDSSLMWKEFFQHRRILKAH